MVKGLGFRVVRSGERCRAEGLYVRFRILLGALAP